MQIFKLILNVFLGFAAKFRQGIGIIFNRFVDKESGKFLSPKMLKLLFWVIGFFFFAFVIISQSLKGPRQSSDSIERLEKEMRAETGVRGRGNAGGTIFDQDPLVAVIGNKTPAGSVGPDLTNGATGVENASGDCFELIEKLKLGGATSSEEKSKLDACLASNSGRLSPEDLALLKALNSGNLSSEQRKAIVHALGAEATPEERAASVALAMSKTPEGREALKDAMKKAGVNLNDADVERVVKNTDPGSSSGVLKSIIDSALGRNVSKEDLDAAGSKLKPVAKGALGESSSLDNPDLEPDQKKLLTKLVEDVAQRESEIKGLRAQLDSARADAKEAVQKMADGKKISDSDQKTITEMSDLQKELSEKEAIQEKRKDTLNKVTENLQITLAQAIETMKEVIPSAIMTDQMYLAEKKAGKLPIKQLKPKRKIAKSKPLPVRRDVKDEFYKTQSDGLKRLALGDQENFKLDTLFVAKGVNNSQLGLDPSQKIAAYLDSEVLVSSNGSGQNVRVKLFQDVYDPRKGTIVVPKGSVLIGHASSFDEETGVMEMLFTKVTVGGKSLDVKLRVGSADGAYGLKGEVRDTRGRYLVGAFITAFSSGVLNWFSQTVVSTYQSQKDVTSALIGASAAGGADVMKKVSDLTAGDLQNAPKVFYCPRGVPVVLFPE